MYACKKCQKAMRLAGCSTCLGCASCVLRSACCSVREVSRDVKCFMDLFDQVTMLVQARDLHSEPRVGSEYRNCVFGECAPVSRRDTHRCRNYDEDLLLSISANIPFPLHLPFPPPSPFPPSLSLSPLPLPSPPPSPFPPFLSLPPSLSLSPLPLPFPLPLPLPLPLPYSPLLPLSCAPGCFIRRCVVEYRRLTFTQLLRVHSVFSDFVTTMHGKGEGQGLEGGALQVKRTQWKQVCGPFV